MKIVSVSPYKNNVVLSKGKVVLSNLADYLVTMVLTLLLYLSLGNPIFSSLPSTSHLKDSILASQSSLNSLVNETRLQIRKSDGSLTSPEEMAKSFVGTYAKTSYYLNAKEYPFPLGTRAVAKEETFLSENYVNDPLSYYFFVYKSYHQELDFYSYGGKDYASNKEEGFYSDLSGFSDPKYEGYFVSKDPSLSKYRTLDLDKASLLVDYLEYKDPSPAPQKIYDNLHSSFMRMEKIFIAEVEDNLPSFRNYNQVFLDSYRKLSLGYLASLGLSFLFAFLVEEFLIPLILKEGRTVGLRCFKGFYATYEEMEPTAKNLALKGLGRLLIHLSSAFLVSYLYSSLSLFFLPLVGNLSAFYLIICSFVLGIASIILTLLSKNNQGFAELIAHLLIKDPLVFEQGSLKQKDEEKGKENG